MKGKCSDYVQKKIRKNMGELKWGGFKNRAQAIGVAFGQVKSEHPACKQYLRQKKKK